MLLRVLEGGINGEDDRSTPVPLSRGAPSILPSPTRRRVPALHDAAALEEAVTFSASDAALAKTKTGAYAHRVTQGLLAVIAGLSGVAAVVGLVSGPTRDVVGEGTAAARALVLATASTSAAALAIRWVHGRTRREWPLRALTAGLALLTAAALPANVFRGTIPQLVWGPILIAFALTELRWAIGVGTLTLLAVAFFHHDHGAFHDVSTVVVSAGLLATVVALRMIFDRGIAAEHEQTLRVRFLAFHDALTGLPNRRLLRDRLEEGLKKSKRADQKLALLFVDIDHFAAINDSLGHERGDQLIVEATRRIRKAVRDTDTLARFGGDEFVLVLSELPERAIVDRVIRSLQGALEEPFALGDASIRVTASVGVAFYPDDAVEARELLQNADQALFRAKANGRNQVSYFTAELQQQAHRRLQLAQDLAHAIDDGQLHVVFQPILHLTTGRIRKAEALLRWTHPTEGPISPAVFIPIAESNGLIGAIGAWVFRESLKQVKRWRAELDPSFEVSVNRSPVQFREESDDRPSWQIDLDDVGLAANSVVLEITEGILLESNDRIQRQLGRMRAAGVRLSLDDFGTGYSSLSYLHRYDLDYVKIDRSFVSGLAPGSKERILCDGIIAMAHALRLAVVAEGVETSEQADLLRELGCDYAQGYYFGKPMLPEALEALVRRTHAELDGRASSPEADDAGRASGTARTPGAADVA